jgi:hypothetical protein
MQSKPRHSKEHCLERAAACERLAEQAVGDENRTILLELAARWRALAELDASPPDKG